MFSAGAAGCRIERRPSVEPSQKRRSTERARAARASVAATSGEQQRVDGRRPSSRRGHGRVTAQRSTAQETRRVQCRGEGRRVQRRPSLEPSRTSRPADRAREARTSVAATNGEQQQLAGGRPSSRRGHWRVTAQRSTAQETRRVQSRSRRPPQQATAECRAVANAAADRTGARSAREYCRDERREAATRRRAAVKPSRPRACDRAEKRGATGVLRSAQEAKAAASSGGRVSSHHLCGDRPSGRE